MFPSSYAENSGGTKCGHRGASAPPNFLEKFYIVPFIKFFLQNIIYRVSCKVIHKLRSGLLVRPCSISLVMPGSNPTYLKFWIIFSFSLSFSQLRFSFFFLISFSLPFSQLRFFLYKINQLVSFKKKISSFKHLSKYLYTSFNLSLSR